MQLNQPERGFSFQADGPLDMRMSLKGATAADVVNGLGEEELANILYLYGEERRSRAIARAIVKARTDAPFATTRSLADLVTRVLGGRKEDGRHPATRTFQALRIYVNDELSELAQGLSAAERCLKPGGRLVVVTFHSLEDRIVKRFFTSRAGKEIGTSRHLPEQSLKSKLPSFRIVNSRPLTPSKGELEVNPRARSARARVGVRTEAPAWAADDADLGLPSIET
jgi:16S rRNA (cytosine1402-N4)-methyltransferase